MFSSLLANSHPHTFPIPIRASKKLQLSPNFTPRHMNPNPHSFRHDTMKDKKWWFRKEERKDFFNNGGSEIITLCGLGYFLQGCRCFPWLALNFHMAQYLNLNPSTLQLVQFSGNFPMVAKPLIGVISDSVYINGDHRIPYLLIGVTLQILSWIPLSVVPAARGALPALMVFIFLSNIGASVAEVAKDALVAEYGKRRRQSGLQSYAFMATALGGIIGNLLGGYFLGNLHPKSMFLGFSILLFFQFIISFSVKEDSLVIPIPPTSDSLVNQIKKQVNELRSVLSNKPISGPLIWAVASISMVPLLSGSVFCYQTQILQLDPSVIGMSRVVSQLILFITTMVYNRFLKGVPLRLLVSILQILYAFSLLLDVVLVKRLNLQVGIPDEVFVLCFSGLSETLAQFKLLPFSIYLTSLCPKGCEASLTSFMAAVFCFSSIISGVFGVVLASTIGINGGDFSGLQIGILVQFFTALLPLCGASRLPNLSKKQRNRAETKFSTNLRCVYGGKLARD